MYKLLNKLFGWDYISWHNGVAQGIARVHVNPDGVVWYWVYRSIKVSNIITDPRTALWLTCSSSKYFPPRANKYKSEHEYMG